MVSNITGNNVNPMNLMQEKSEIPEEPLPVLNDVEQNLEALFSEKVVEKAPPDKTSEIKNEGKLADTPKAKPKRKKGSEAKKPPKKATAGSNTKPKGGKTDKNSNSKVSGKNVEQKKKTKENGGKSKVKVDAAPFLQIQSNGSFQIVNQIANGDDDAEKSSSKPKKSTNEKHKNIRGLHVSTLSNKYDAEKRDTTWVCVFCKIEPHRYKMGDLFGPYIISKTSKEYSYCLEDPANDIFRQGNSKKFAPISLTPSKKKRKNSEGNTRKLTSPTPITDPNLQVFNGMTKIDEDHYEVRI